jgi:predicted DNA-binding transcriptional regulator YafY
VEPYGFSASLDTLYAFEPSSKRNKTYKMVRIGQVRLERIPWQFAHLHEVPKTDAFGMPMGDSILEVHLHLGQLSSNLLREEQPAAALFLSPLLTTNSGGRVHELQLRVADYRGIGRFVLGLIDDIDVIGPPDFVKYLRKRIISLNK